ncbi:unnamed protein product [Leuciscus chuanchicus]
MPLDQHVEKKKEEKRLLSKRSLAVFLSDCRREHLKGRASLPNNAIQPFHTRLPGLLCYRRAICWDNSTDLFDTVPPGLRCDRPPAGFPLPPPLCNYLIRVPLTSAPLPPYFNESINASGTIPDPWQTSLNTYFRLGFARRCGVSEPLRAAELWDGQIFLSESGFQDITDPLMQKPLHKDSVNRR